VKSILEIYYGKLPVLEKVILSGLTLEDKVGRKLDLFNHLLHCRNTVPLYGGIDISGDPFESLRRIPVFDKARYPAALPETVSSLPLQGVRRDTTSGTSGSSFSFLVSRDELAIRKAYELVANRMLGLSPGDRYLQIWGGHESQSLPTRLKNALYDQLTGRRLVVVRGGDRLSLEGCETLFRRYAGKVLITYPSILHGICLNLGLSSVLNTYKAIILTGEAVDYRLFEPFGLGQNLRNRYGSREFGVIGICDSGAMRYFARRFVVENDPEHGLLITDLAKKAMPMLRYPIGDFADASYQTPNTHVQIDQLAPLGRLHGRKMDVLIGRSGREYVGTFWTLAMKKHLHVDKFRIRGTDAFQIEIHYAGGAGEADVARCISGLTDNDFDVCAIKRADIAEISNAKQKIVERICSRS
jgi:phenylacetate-coenzyme A ligase PaaK-like adenylate-forming protein